MNLEELLNWFYKEEVNILICSAYDSGYVVELGSRYFIGSGELPYVRQEFCDDMEGVQEVLTKWKLELEAN